MRRSTQIALVTSLAVLGAELRPGGLVRRSGQQPRGILLDEVEGEFPDAFQLGQHADQNFGAHRVRPCT